MPSVTTQLVRIALTVRMIGWGWVDGVPPQAAGNAAMLMIVTTKMILIA